MEPFVADSRLSSLLLLLLGLGFQLARCDFAKRSADLQGSAVRRALSGITAYDQQSYSYHTSCMIGAGGSQSLGQSAYKLAHES